VYPRKRNKNDITKLSREICGVKMKEMSNENMAKIIR